MTREEIIKELLKTIKGESLEREGLLDTPKRISKMYDELFSGYSQKPEDVLNKLFKTNNNQMVVVQDIDFFSHCEHHMVPFFGKVHIGYIPNGKKVVGLSKFPRLVKIFSQRLQIQENMTEQIAEAIMRIVEPKGVGVIIKAQHLCISMRGIKTPNSITTTNALRGVFLDKPEVRLEFIGLINL